MDTYISHRALLALIIVIVVVKIKVIVKRRQETGRLRQRGRPAPAAPTQLYATSQRHAVRDDLLISLR